jgi:hypothetical protein
VICLFGKGIEDCLGSRQRLREKRKTMKNGSSKGWRTGGDIFDPDSKRAHKL